MSWTSPGHGNRLTVDGQFQLKTGGFGAEFGRSTGGVSNAITKRGTKEWKFGAGAFFETSSLNGESPDMFTGDGEIYQRYSGDERGGQEIYLQAGGRIIEDTLFIFATCTFPDYTRENFGTSQYRSDEDDEPFWGAKVNWNISDDHSIEVTAFSERAIH